MTTRRRAASTPEAPEGAQKPRSATKGRKATLSTSVAVQGASGGFYSAPKLTERQFQGQVLRYAALTGWKAWHDNATNAPRKCGSCGAFRALPRNASGLPDLILVRRPRVVWVELKSDRGKLSDDQRDWLDELRACGQEVYVWRPEHWHEIEKVLR